MEHEAATEPTTDHVARPTANTPIDLDGIERDLADVETALARLDAGTYWTDEISGEPLLSAFLAEHPTARRAHAD